MSTLEYLMDGYRVNRDEGNFPRDAIGACEKLLIFFGNELQSRAVDVGLRASDMGVFHADKIAVVSDATQVHFVFVVAAPEHGMSIEYEKLLTRSLTTETAQTKATFHGGDVVYAFSVPIEQIITEANASISRTANTYVDSVYAAQQAAIADKERNKTRTESSNRNKRPITNQVFVVHGHDEAMKEAVARVLERQDLEPIILSEWPGRGMTIIEKFEAHADVGFAVVLLSPDDLAYSKGGSQAEAKSRGRQNVIFELGFFVGRLGRNRVLVIHRKADNFEMLSDYAGVEYKAYDNRKAWATELVKELKAAGYDVSADKIP